MRTRLFQQGVLPIGLDLAASGVKALQFSKTAGRLKVAAAARIESEAESPADEARLGALAKLIERKLRAGDFRGRQCIIGLDDRLLRVRSVRLPSMTDPETEQSLRVDAATRLGFGKDEAIVTGWTRAGAVQQGDEQREEIILTGILAEHAERIVDMAMDAGLEPLALEPNFCATARCFSRRRRRAADQQIAQIVVDLGRRTTNVLAMRGETLCFYKQIDWGSERLDRAAAERLDMDQAVVSEIRRQRLRDTFAEAPQSAKIDDRVDRAIFDAVRPLLNELAQEIALCVRYFLVTFRGANPEGIVLAGGDATEPRLLEIVSELAGLPTTLGRPLEGIELGSTSLPMNRRGPLSEWATAAGLSLRGESRTNKAGMLNSFARIGAPLAALRRAA